MDANAEQAKTNGWIWEEIGSVRVAAAVMDTIMDMDGEVLVMDSTRASGRKVIYLQSASYAKGDLSSMDYVVRALVDALTVMPVGTEDQVHLDKVDALIVLGGKPFGLTNARNQNRLN